MSITHMNIMDLSTILKIAKMCIFHSVSMQHFLVFEPLCMEFVSIHLKQQIQDKHTIPQPTPKIGPVLPYQGLLNIFKCCETSVEVKEKARKRVFCEIPFMYDLFDPWFRAHQEKKFHVHLTIPDFCS